MPETKDADAVREAEMAVYRQIEARLDDAGLLELDELATSALAFRAVARCKEVGYSKKAMLLMIEEVFTEQVQ